MMEPSPVTIDLVFKNTFQIRAVTKREILPVQAETEYIDPEPGAAKSDSSPGHIFQFMNNKNLAITNDGIKEDKLLISQGSTDNASSNIYFSDLQYLPADNAEPVERWSIAAMASPTYYSRFSSGSDVLSSQLMSSEQPLMSYSGGVAFSYKLSRRFSVQSGLYYSALGQKVEGINSFGGFKQYDNTKGDNNFEVLTSSGVVSASNPDVFLNADASERVITAFTKDVFDPKKASLQYINNSLTQSFSYLELPVNSEI